MVVLMSFIGIVSMGSASYATAYNEHKGDSYFFVKKQALFLVAGFVIMIAISHFDYRKLKKRVLNFKYFSITWGHVIWFLTVILLVMVPLFGIKDENNIRRRLKIIVEFQPSELFKLAVIIILAYYLSTYYKKLSGIGMGLVGPLLYLLPVYLIWIQPHASCTLIILLIAITMMFVGGCFSLKNICVGCAGAAAVWIVYGDKLKSKVGHLGDRISLWLSGTSSSGADTYQTDQSMYAIGSGGLLGRGFGKSRQKMLFLPEPQNDFVFSVFCEEWGFVGAVVIIILFAVLIGRGMQIAVKAKDKFGGFLVFGIMMLVSVQTCMNIAVVTNIMPNTGISLPFFSYGGTALVVLLAEMGIVLSVSRYSRIEKV